jgi:sugar lactone lactonase YvrE
MAPPCSRRRRGSIAALAVLGALLAAAAVAPAATCPGSGGKRCAYDRIAVYGEGAPSELHTPRGVAVGADGRIYVADTNAFHSWGRLNVYDRAGAYVGQLSPGTDFQPVDVGVSTDGTVYALDLSGTLVHRFDAAGRYTALKMPYGYSGTPGANVRSDSFAVQSDGTFWILYRQGFVEHRDRAGALIGSFTVPVQSNLPAITAAPDGHLLVGNPDGDVSEYSPSGSLVRTLNVPAGSRMSIAPDGDLVSGVVSTVYRIGRDGTGLTQFGSHGTAPGAFEQIEGVAVAPPGALAAGRPGEEVFVVADRDNHRVQIVAPDGAPLAVIGAPQDSTLLHPAAAWGMPDGRLLVADTHNRRIVSYTPSGAFGGRVDAGVAVWPEAGAYNPASGESIVLDGTVRRLGADGTWLGSWPLRDDEGGTGFGPALAVGEDGTIYAAHAPGAHGAVITAYAPDGTPTRRISDPHLAGPTGLAPGPGGELFVLESDGSHEWVDVLGPDGTYRRKIDALCRDTTHSIAVDAAGRIYAGQANRIAIFDRDGAVLARFGEAGTGIGQFDGTRLSVLGNVLTIAEVGNNRVTRVRIDPAALGSPEPAPCNRVYAPISSGRVHFGARTIAVRRARARVPLACVGAAAARCAGSVTLLRRSVKARGRLKRKDVLASAPFRVGRSGLVALKLKPAERRTLRRKHKLKVQLLVASKRGGPILRDVTLKLKKAKATPKKKVKTTRR